MRPAARVTVIAGNPAASELEALLDFQMRAAGLPEWECEFRFSPCRRWRADRAWPHLKLLVEVEGGVWTGGRHVHPQGFEDDCIKYSEAAILGYRVVRVTGAMVKDGRALDLIMRAMGAS